MGKGDKAVYMKLTTEILETYLPHHHFVHHKSHMT
jgi:hypothetical protein